MRWRAKLHGDFRTVKRFLFLPRRIEGEVRWLELVKIRQRYNYDKINILNCYWLDEGFLNEDGTLQEIKKRCYKITFRRILALPFVLIKFTIKHLLQNTKAERGEVDGY